MSLSDAELIAEITVNTGRACFDYSFPHDSLKCAKALMACHTSNCPLNLPALAKAEGQTLLADVLGIQRHMKNGKLEGFIPRFAKEGV